MVPSMWEPLHENPNKSPATSWRRYIQALGRVAGDLIISLLHAEKGIYV